MVVGTYGKFSEKREKKLYSREDRLGIYNEKLNLKCLKISSLRYAMRTISQNLIGRKL